MRRFALVAAFVLALGMPVVAQHEAESSGHAEKTGAEHEESYDGWKWANFAILAGALGYMIAKGAPQFFRSRTEEIQRGIAEATRLKQDAEARAADMERRMAALQTEIEKLRAESRSEMAKETERLRQETEQTLARIQAHGEHEVTAIAKHAQQDLRAYSAQLAIELAEQRIRARMSPETQGVLFDGFLSGLDRNAAEVRR